MKIAIIGAGAAGLMVAGLLDKRFEVTIFDGNEKCGKKIYITGKGRCNLTNNCSAEDYLAHAVRGGKFMMSAISRFTPADCMEYFEKLGLKLKVERGGRVFPQSDKASDVTKILQKQVKGKFRLEERVKKITFSSDKFLVKTDRGEYFFDKVVIATGGESYTATGSRGDGYGFAESFGHTIVPLRPALVPIKLGDKVAEFEGLSLKNVSLHARADGKKLEEFGELMFTHDGISGPIALTLSSQINRADKVELYLDLKPALSSKQLESRLLREFEERNKNLSNILKRLLPKNFVEFFMKKAELEDSKINAVTHAQRERIIRYLKEFPLEFKSLYPVEAGVVTSGGVELKQVSPKTMESKLQKGLYFVGEVLDIDCLTGGFNLQTAFATGYVCATEINKEGV